jgi:hypothetical protein
VAFLPHRIFFDRFNPVASLATIVYFLETPCVLTALINPDRFDPVDCFGYFDQFGHFGIPIPDGRGCDERKLSP